VDVCAAGLGVALDEARARVWVACAGGDAAQVALVDVSGAPRLERMLPLDDGSGSPGVSAAYLLLDGKHAYVSAQGSGDLWIFDQDSGALVRRIALGSDSFPQRMALTPDGVWVLLCVDGLQQLAAIDTTALEVLDRIPTGTAHPQAIAVTPDGAWAVITDENDLVHPGHVARIPLATLGTGAARIDAWAQARVFPQPVIMLGK
jgi:DNA-binding beta-propeller fold protein YncE